MTNTMTATRSQAPLRRVLLLDAAASGALGVLGAAGSSALDDLLGLPAALLLGVGVFLVVYALGLVVLSRLATVPRGLTWVVVLGDGAWVLASVALVVGIWSDLTVLGAVVVLAQAAAVAVFAELQYTHR
ncbi:hypothetical protein [Actinomycetospora termitidis]|uniref:Integral membrane protein n=1 Tax=Actinomycetospora termitidis TaxID=3053470 RepID=A0ABT7MC07_9PSEU|nr:hypothetical protein [Actinomycetospora sp. Odt1-22]MDL5158211.1 hypothetical protein [Actinomycetospora sp. Odt1-22]